MLCTNGTTMWKPGYKVPGATPEIWLTSTPAIPLGTIVIDAPASSGKHATSAHRKAMRQRTAAKVSGPDAPSAMRSALARYTSHNTSPMAPASKPIPEARNKYLSNNIGNLLTRTPAVQTMGHRRNARNSRHSELEPQRGLCKPKHSVCIWPFRWGRPGVRVGADSRELIADSG